MDDVIRPSVCRRHLFHVVCAAAVAGPLAVRAVGAVGAEEAAPIRFGCDLSADEQSAPTDSPGRGRADFLLDRKTLKFSWVINYSGVTSAVTGVRIHGPQLVGTNAGVLIDTGADGVASPLRGSTVIDDGMLQFLLSGRMYVNVTTTNYRVGELRGQIKRLRQPPT